MGKGENMKEDTNTPSLRFKGFEGQWEEKKLGEILQTLPFKEFLKEPEVNGKFEVIQQGNDPVLGFANGSPCYDYLDTVVFGDHTMSLYKPRKPFFVATDGVRILKGKTDFNGDYLFSLLERFKPQSEGYKRYYGIVSDSECSITFDLNEQRQIGAMLHNFDVLISLQEKKLGKLEVFKKAMLEKMFPQKGSRVPEIRFQGFTGLWEERKASFLFIATADKGHPDLPVLAATQDCGMVRRDQHNINIFHNKENEKGYKRVLPGQFVIHLRSFQGGFAYSDIEGITSPAYTVFGLTEPDKHCSQFWKYIFSSESFVKRLETVTYGIRDGRSISYDEFLTLSFLFPSKEEQAKIAQYLESIDRLLSLHRQKLEKLQSIKKALLGQMFPSTSRARESERSEKNTEPEQAAPAASYDTKASIS